MAADLSPEVLHKLEERAIMKHYWMLGEPAVNAHTNLARTYPLNHPEKRSVYDWYKHFSSGCTSIADLPRSGTPILNDEGKDIQQLLIDKPKATVDIMAEELGYARGTIKDRLLHELHFIKVSTRWVPHLLTQAQKDKRVELAAHIYDQLIHESDSSYAYLLTGDESWMFYDYPVVSQWVAQGTPRPIAERRTVASKKTMLTAMFTGKSFWLLDFKPEKGAITAQYYIDEILETVEQEMIELLPNAKDEVRLLVDNAPAHNANITKEYIQNSIFERVDHPPYSPDLAPSDFWLFGEMKGRMRGRTFETQDQLADFCTEFVEKQDEQKLSSVFEDWSNRCLKVIDRNGEYIY
ncbi:MAG: putative Mariner Mos1 transposase [Streblomastix strix]|uniref:Putative Mariner Mos1 transposase n=1 Tax=Streblomastix strix TaxID=222440 RepID=A0A5J4U896_9EUKA|nr:MAG: putative Mariner Mos1 transposase [Streblomastix strix]